MNFPITLILNGGLFDFDLTFVIQAILFTILALVTTNVFLSPISKQLDERSEFINYTLRKATILLTFGYEKFINDGIITKIVNELKINQNWVKLHPITNEFRSNRNESFSGRVL